MRVTTLVAVGLSMVAVAAVACSSDDDAGTGAGTTGAPDAAVDASTSPDGGDGPRSGDLQFLSISDWHGQLEPLSENDANKVSQLYGGIATLKAYFDQERAKNPSTLVFAGGDSFGATPVISGFFDDEPAVKGLDYLGLTADTFGNHNFDNGTAAAKKLLDLATYTPVSTNLQNVETELGPKVKVPYLIVPSGGLRVAVLGITSPDAPSLVFPGRLGSIVIKEPIAAANDAAAKARAEGADVVVCLVHMGATGTDAAGKPVGPALAFAEGLAGVDVVFADHTDVVVNETINSTLVVENRSKGRTYARVAVHVESGKVTSKKATIVDALGLHTAFLTCDAGADGGACTCPDVACPAGYACNTGKCQKNEVTPDPGAAAILDPYKAQLATKLDAKLGTSNGLFARGGTVAVERTQETPEGDLVADALLDAYRTSDGAQIAFTNGGGLRDSLPSSTYKPVATGYARPAPYAPASAPPWDVTVGDAYSVLPFGNTAVVRKISGQLLWQVLEYSLAKLPSADGRFLQIAGFKVTASLSSVPRVQSVTLLDAGGSPVKAIPSNDTTEYVAVTNDFTSSGGDGYAMLKETTPTAGRSALLDLLIAYVKKTTPLDPAKYPAGGRIAISP